MASFLVVIRGIETLQILHWGLLEYRTPYAYSYPWELVFHQSVVESVVDQSIIGDQLIGIQFGNWTG